MNYEMYAKEIAKVCNCDSTSVLEILKLSEERKTLYHGIKEQKVLENIIRKGIEPKTPEEGYTSCWSTGLRLFVNSNILPITDMHTYNTPFFHYAHAVSDPNISRMQLAVTDQSTLSATGIKFKWINNSQINISEIVSPEAFTTLVLVLKHRDFHKEDTDTARKRGALAEKIMIKMLLEHLRNYSAGKRFTNEVGE